MDPERSPEAVPADAGDVVLGCLAQIRAAAAVIAQAALWSRSDDLARAGVAEGFAAAQAVQAAWLSLVADLDDRPGAVAGARAGAVAKTFLRQGLCRSAGQAGADVRAARALLGDPREGGLPQLGRAFGAGEVSREHVDVAVRAMRRLPRGLLARPMPDPRAAGCDRDGPGRPHPDGGDPDADGESGEAEAGAVVSGGEVVDAFVTEQARGFDPQQTDRLARHLLAALDPDGAETFDPQAVERRELTLATDATGMVITRGQLDAAAGASFTTAIQHFSAPEPVRQETATDGTAIQVIDTRTARQRRADALGIISRIALASAETETRGGEPPRIVIHTNVQQVRDALQRKQNASIPPQPNRASNRLGHGHGTKPDSAESGGTQPDDVASGGAGSDSAGPGGAEPGAGSDSAGPGGPEPGAGSDSAGPGGPEPGAGSDSAGPGGPEPGAGSDSAESGGTQPDDVASGGAGSDSAGPGGPEPGAGSDSAGPGGPEPGAGSDSAGPGGPEPGGAGSRDAGSEFDDHAVAAAQSDVPASRVPTSPTSPIPTSSIPTSSIPASGVFGGGGRRGGRCNATCSGGGNGESGWGELVSPRLLERYVCDAVLQKALIAPTGAVLDLGRDVRTVSAAQRRALVARDRGCVIPACGAPASWCEAHHVIWWRHGGRTDITNLALVCGRHHTDIHLGIWELTMIDGTAWARPPTWIDRQRRLIRNTYHHATDQARHLGTQLRLNLTDTPGSNQSTTPASAPDDPSPDKPEQTTLRPRPDDSPPGEPDREAETPLDDTD